MITRPARHCQGCMQFVNTKSITPLILSSKLLSMLIPGSFVNTANKFERDFVRDEQGELEWPSSPITSPQPPSCSSCYLIKLPRSPCQWQHSPSTGFARPRAAPIIFQCFDTFLETLSFFSNVAQDLAVAIST